LRREGDVWIRANSLSDLESMRGPSQGSTNFILEYELTDWLRRQANVLQGALTQQSIFRRAQGSGADLIFFFSF
jgi:hypothetical protein